MIQTLGLRFPVYAGTLKVFESCAVPTSCTLVALYAWMVFLWKRRKNTETPSKSGGEIIACRTGLPLRGWRSSLGLRLDFLGSSCAANSILKCQAGKPDVPQLFGLTLRMIIPRRPKQRVVAETT